MSPKLKRTLGLGSIGLALVGSVGATGYYAPKVIRAAQSALPVMNTNVKNALGISSVKRSDAVKSKIMTGPGTIRNKYPLKIDPSKGDVQGNPGYNFQSGSPYHDQGYTGSLTYRGNHDLAPGRRYDTYDIGYYHSDLEHSELQNDGGTGTVMIDELPSEEPSNQIIVKYPKSATLQGHGKVDTYVYINDIKYYKPWRYGRSLVFSHNLHNGFRFNGIKSMHVSYRFFKNGKQITDLSGAYMKFYHLDGETKWGLNPSNEHGVLESSLNNESYVNMEDYHYNYLRTLFNKGNPIQRLDESKKYFDPSAQFINADSGTSTSGKNDSEYALTKGSHIAQYGGTIFAKDIGANPIGGRWDVSYPGGYDPRNGVGFAIHGSSADFRTGSAMGYGLLKPETKMASMPSKLHKTASNAKSGYRINKNGSFSYTLNGTIPTNISSSDRYQFYDKAPGEVSVSSAKEADKKSLKLPVRSDGNKAYFNLTGKQIDQDRGKQFHIQVNVRADHIPKDPEDTLSNPTDGHHSSYDPDNKVYTFWNEGHYRIDRNNTGTPNGNPNTPNGKPKKSNPKGTPAKGKWRNSNPVPEHTPDKNKPKPPHVPQPESKPTPISKSVHKNWLHHPGEKDTYTVSGQIPVRKHNNKSYETPNYGVTGTGSDGKASYGVTGYTTHWYDGYKGDHYKLSDQLPKDVSVTSVDWDGMPHGHHSKNYVGFNMNNDDIDAHSGQHYQIKIHFKADHLPKINPSKNYHNDNHHHGSAAPQGRGIYTFWNQAHADEKVYTKNGDADNAHEHTQWVPVSIRKIEYHLFHYDYDWKNGSKFMPKSEVKARGHNYQYDGANSGSFWDFYEPNSRATEKGGHSDILKPEGNTDDFDQSHSLNKGHITSQPAFGYQGSRIKEPIINGGQYGYKLGNQNWKYRYMYGEKSKYAYPLLGYNTTKPSKSGLRTTYKQDFYFPYIVPRAKFGNRIHGHYYERMLVDTAKAGKNSPNDGKGYRGVGLPFRFDVRGDSYLYNYFKDYDHARLHIVVHQGHSKNGRVLYDSDHPSAEDQSYAGKPRYLDKVMTDAHHGNRNGIEFAGHLRNIDTSQGTRIPFYVEVKADNPDHIQIDTNDLMGHAFVATQRTTKDTDSRANLSKGIKPHDKGYNKQATFDGDTAKSTDPERTITYAAGNPSDDVTRTLYEHMKFSQDRDIDGARGYDAEGKTGFGLKPGGIRLSYTGNLRTNTYGKRGTKMDFAFPRIWNQDTTDQAANSDIKYPSDPYKHDSLGAINSHGSNDQIGSGGNANPLNSHYMEQVRMLADALLRTHSKPNHSKPSKSNPSGDKGGNSRYVDNYFDGGDKSGNYGSIGRNAFPGFQGPSGDPEADLAPIGVERDAGTYSTDYSFSKRNLANNDDSNTASHPKGNAMLDDGSTVGSVAGAGKAHNDLGAGADSVGAQVSYGHRRMYTPFWLGIGDIQVDMNGLNDTNSTKTLNPIYPNIFEKDHDSKSDESRLGGNWFNIDENRAILMYAHAMLAKQTHTGKNENSDELAIQPYLPGNGNEYGGQNVKGFTSAENRSLHGNGNLGSSLN